jgi:hypothetical protein
LRQIFNPRNDKNDTRQYGQPGTAMTDTTHMDPLEQQREGLVPGAAAGSVGQTSIPLADQRVEAVDSAQLPRMPATGGRFMEGQV